jgi:chloramphenicol 3-O-phosphotransferase
MASRLYLSDLDLNKNQLLQPVAQVLGAHPASPTSGQFWYRNDLSNGVGNGQLYYRDASGNNVALAVGGVALSDAYSTITDGTTPATATGATTFKLRATGTGLAVATQNNDGTHGDNANFTLDSAVSGNTKVLLTDSSGRITHNNTIDLGGPLTGTVQGRLGHSGGILSFYITAASSFQQILDGYNNASVAGRLTFTGATGWPVWNSTTPTVDGGLGYDTTNHVFQYHNGTGLDSLVATGKAMTLSNKTLVTPTIASFVNATHNHQSAAGGGTLVAAAITDFDTQVRTSRLDQMAAPTASVNLNSQKIIGLLAGTAATDAVNKSQLDAVQTGLDTKQSVRAASTANVAGITYNATGGTSGRGQITTAPNALDGVTLVAGDRIGLFGQTTGAQNGLYTVTTVGTGATGVWDRATDFDADIEVTSGAYVFVEEGTANADRGYQLITNNPITIGGASGTTLVWTPFSGAGSIIDGAGLVFTGNTLDVVGTAGRIVANANSIDLASGVATPGTGVICTVDTYGRVTAYTDLLAGNGIPARTAANTYTARTITGNAGRVILTNGDGVGGNPTIDLATGIVTPGTYFATTVDTYGRVTAGADIVGAGGFPARTAAFTYAARTITGNAGRIVLTNGDGVAGNPTIDLASGIATAGTYDRVTVDTYGRVTGGTLTTAMGFAGNIGDGTTTSIVVTHNLGTKDVIAVVYDNTTPFGEVYCEIRHTSTTTLTLVFNTAPSATQYRVVIRAI